MGINSRNSLVNIVAWVINAVAASGTVAAAYGGMVNPEITSIPAILAMTLPGWLMLAVTVLVVDLFVGRIRRMAVLPVLALVVSVGPVMDYAPLNFNVFSRDDAHGKPEEFTVMSYNVYDLIDMTLDSVGRLERYNSYEPNPTVDQILQTGADILALQECPALKTNRNLNITPAQSDSIARRYPFGQCVIGERIYSRYPLTPVELRQPESDWGIFSAAVADIDGRQVLLVSVHMQSIGLNDNDKALFRDLTEGEVEGRRKIKRVKQQLLSKLSSAFKERAKQARLLRHEIDSIGIENVIVAGDFNDIPGCYALRELCRDDFRNAFTEAGCGPIVTYHANRFYFHIDHIVYRGNMEAVAYRRGDCEASDHYPVIATFRWTD